MVGSRVLREKIKIFNDPWKFYRFERNWFFNNDNKLVSKWKKKKMYYSISLVEVVRRGTTIDLLDLRFLFHTGVPHGCASKLREEIQDTDRSPRLRFWASQGKRIRYTAGRRRLHLRLVPRRSPFQYEYDETGRIVPENFVRRRASREYHSSSTFLSIFYPNNKDSVKFDPRRFYQFYTLKLLFTCHVSKHKKETREISTGNVIPFLPSFRGQSVLPVSTDLATTYEKGGRTRKAHVHLPGVQDHGEKRRSIDDRPFDQLRNRHMAADGSWSGALDTSRHGHDLPIVRLNRSPPLYNVHFIFAACAHRIIYILIYPIRGLIRKTNRLVRSLIKIIKRNELKKIETLPELCFLVDRETRLF